MAMFEKSGIFKKAGSNSGGGSDPHNLGWYETPAALSQAHPIANAGDWAIVGSTDTVWVWDTDTTAWVDTDKKGQVTSVNSQTGAVVLTASDVGALPSNTHIPADPVQADWTQTTDTALDYIKNKPTLGTAAAAATTDFATAAQGAKADTAVQPSDLATVATSGDYEDLTNKPVIPAPGIPQYDTMPTASASNVGEIAQYSGTTIPDVPASATISQTVGSGLTDLAVNLDTFVSVEQPTDDETVDFVCNTIIDSMSQTSGSEGGMTVVIDDVSKFISQLQTDAGITIDNGTTINVLAKSGPLMFAVEVTNSVGQQSSVWDRTSEYFSDYGIEVTGESASSSTWEHTIIGSVYSKLASWEKDENAVNLAAYGISYSGTPIVDDTLTVAYTAPVAGITNGYFYKNEIEYSDPTATISQTVGSGLTDLTVDVDTFIEAEQPAQSETVNFVANVISDSVVFNVVQGNFTVSIPFSGLRQLFIDQGRDFDGTPMYWSGVFTFYFGGTQCGFGPSAGSDWVFISDIQTQAAQYGLVITGEPTQGIDNYAEYVASTGTTSWKKGLETVSLDEYGISYSGNPDDGDILAVVYTAPEPVGYNWNQKDVQPSSGGGNAEIGWETKVDLPAEYTGGWEGCSPYWTIAGGLPDGEYEFYFSTKCTNDNYSPIGEVVFKVVMKIDNQQNTFHGRMGYVFDGNYMNDSSYNVFGSGREWYNIFRKDGNDLILYCRETPFSCVIPAYISPLVLIKDCWKLSAIKNVETGQKYIATGNLNLDGSWPSYTQDMYGSVVLSRLANDPYVPPTTTWLSEQVTNLQNNTFAFRVECVFAVLTVKMEDGSSEFVARWYGERTGNGGKPYSQEIVKATGIFENSYLAYTTGYVWLMGVDTATAATLSGMVWATSGCFDSNGAGIWFDIIPQTVNQISQCGPQGYRLGTIVADGVGNIVQYTGETNANYTNGYNYKATGTVVTTPESISPSDYNHQDWVCGVTNLDDLVNAISNLVGWSPSYIRNQMASNNRWYYNVEFSGQGTTITSVGFSFWSTSEPSILQYLTAVYSGSAAGNTEVIFNPNYMPEHKEVQNPSWARIDVQPAGSSSSSITVTLLSTDWVSDEQTVSATGVTTTNSVFIGAAPASITDYDTAGVKCTAQGNGTLTFTCSTTPSNDLTVNVLIM